MPVSWQMGPSHDSAWSMFCAMIVIAWPARVAGASAASAWLMAARTSGGRSVDVRVMRSTTLSKKAGSILTSMSGSRGSGLKGSGEFEGSGPKVLPEPLSP